MFFYNYALIKPEKSATFLEREKNFKFQHNS